MPTATAPSGVVTFLFTDVEGSTRRWEADPDAMRIALAAHDEVLRTAIEAHGGFLFKHTGDGVCAAFNSPKAAVDAAIAAQHVLELPVRMGLATGEAEPRGEDYFGAVLNRAARVMAAGHGDQILLVESTAKLLSGVDLVGLGQRWLRDVPVPVEVFQVRAPGLPTDFPPLRASHTNPGNFRPRTTSFIGREAAVDDVIAAVLAHQVVTLTGAGGVGKTRLALEVAAHVADEFSDGVWFFDLAAVTDPSAVPDAVAAVLAITQQPGKTVSESVVSALENRARLLVIDNCEHVISAASDLIEAIQLNSAKIRILATSREGLGVSDEQLWPVPPLDVDAGIDSSAVVLFTERSRAVAPRFSACDEPEAVIEICRRLDGIPLAIELAASRMASMTAGEVRDRLGQRFRLLVGTRRGLERHQTLRQTVAWSYDLLDDPEKALLDSCSVFSGGFDIQSACAIVPFDVVDDYVVLDLLDALVRKSLLIADPSHGRTRFSILETVRQFAEEQLVARGDAVQVRDAHAHYFASREPDMMALWDGPRQQEAYTWFAVELANLRSAFRWAADQGDLDTAIAIAMCSHVLGTWVEQYEPVAWVEEVIDEARAVGHRRLAQLYVAAAQCYAAGRVGDAVAYVEAGEQAAQSGDFDPVPFEGLSSTSFVHTFTGEPDRWAQLCRRVISGEAGPHPVTRACLAMALYMSGNDEAKAAAEELLAVADETNNPNTASFALMAYGGANLDTDAVAAYNAYRRSLAIARESGNRQLESAVAVMLCGLVATEGDLAFAETDGDAVNAFDYLTVTIRRYHDAGSVSLLHNPLAILATVFEHLGHHQQAAIVSGFAATAMARASYPQIASTIARLRDVLGDEQYESLARTGQAMTTAEMVTYVFDQIARARTGSA
jgi:predicted ATPase/class 3 adenylate cyclase